VPKEVCREIVCSSKWPCSCISSIRWSPVFAGIF